MRPSIALNQKRSAVREVTNRFHTTNPRIFGSVLHGTDQDGSDLDILVDALPGATLFDLGGLAANNGLSERQEEQMLAGYYDRVPDAALRRKYRAMKAAAALRETLWSMVSEIHSELDFDFAAYTASNLTTYRAAFDAFRNA